MSAKFFIRWHFSRAKKLFWSGKKDHRVILYASDGDESPRAYTKKLDLYFEIIPPPYKCFTEHVGYIFAFWTFGLMYQKSGPEWDRKQS